MAIIFRWLVSSSEHYTLQLLLTYLKAVHFEMIMKYWSRASDLQFRAIQWVIVEWVGSVLVLSLSIVVSYIVYLEKPNTFPVYTYSFRVWWGPKIVYSSIRSNSIQCEFFYKYLIVNICLQFYVSTSFIGSWLSFIVYLKVNNISK